MCVCGVCVCGVCVCDVCVVCVCVCMCVVCVCVCVWCVCVCMCVVCGVCVCVWCVVCGVCVCGPTKPCKRVVVNIKNTVLPTAFPSRVEKITKTSLEFAPVLITVRRTTPSASLTVTSPTLNITWTPVETDLCYLCSRKITKPQPK